MSAVDVGTLEAVLSLSPANRLDVIDHILDSLERESDDGVNPLCAQEAQRRWEAAERGEMKTVPPESVFQMMKDGTL